MRLRIKDRSYQSVNWQSPILWRSPLNKDLLSRWQVVPHWSGATVWRDLCKRYDATGTNLDTSTCWARFTHYGGWGSLNLVAASGPDYLTTAASVINPSTSDFSLFMWAYLTSTTTSQTFFSQQNGSGTGRSWMGTDASSLFFTNIGGTATNGPALSAATWYHCGLTKSGTAIAIYLDGKQVATSTRTADSATGALTIGVAKDLASGPMTGNLDDMRLYTRGMNVSEVAQIYADAVAYSPRTLRRWTRSAASGSSFLAPYGFFVRQAVKQAAFH